MRLLKGKVNGILWYNSWHRVKDKVVVERDDSVTIPGISTTPGIYPLLLEIAGSGSSIPIGIGIRVSGTGGVTVVLFGTPSIL